MNRAQQFLITFVRAYQKTFSPDHSFWARAANRPPYCRYFPTCSEYMIEAIEKRGALAGSIQGMGRICRCHPWSK